MNHLVLVVCVNIRGVSAIQGTVECTVPFYYIFPIQVSASYLVRSTQIVRCLLNVHMYFRILVLYNYRANREFCWTIIVAD